MHWNKGYVSHIDDNFFFWIKIQRVVLNGRTSSWEPVLAGVPQALIT